MSCLPLRLARPLLPLLVLLLPGGRVAAQEPLLDARHWQLFFDDYAVARGTGFDRVVHHPRSRGIVIAADRPWETNGVQPLYVARRSDGTFMAFYNTVWGAPGSGARSSTLGDMVYEGGAWRRAARSPTSAATAPRNTSAGSPTPTRADGVHWDKPTLGLVSAPSGVDWKKEPPFPYPTGSSRANNLGVQFGFTDLGLYGGVSDPAKRYAIFTGGRAYFAADIPDFAHDPQWRSRLVEAGGTFSPRGHSLELLGSGAQRMGGYRPERHHPLAAVAHGGAVRLRGSQSLALGAGFGPGPRRSAQSHLL